MAHLRDTVKLQAKLDGLKIYTPRTQLPEKIEADLIDLCTEYKDAWKHDGAKKRFFEKNSEYLDKACSCVNSRAVLPELLDTRCRNFGLKRTTKDQDRMVLCNVSKSIENSANIVESSDSMVACNFQNADGISPDAFIYAGDSTKFFISPTWLVFTLLIIIAVGVVIQAGPILQQRMKELFKYF